MNKAKVRITTKQILDEAGNEDKIELVTEATKEFNGECFIIDYDESKITESEGNKTRLRIYKDKLIMIKMGNLSTKMEFEKNKSFENMYSTPYGSFDISYNTIVYDYSLDEHGNGYVYIEYKIIFGGTEESLNKIKIDIN